MQEDLVTPAEAAKMFYVSLGMIHYWTKKGRIQKYYTDSRTGRWRQYKVSISEIESVRGTWRERLESKYPDLISRKEAASLIGVSAHMISYYASNGHLTKHYVLGNNREYLVEREQVLAQPSRIAEMYRDPERLANLRRHALKQPRDGRLFIKRTD